VLLTNRERLEKRFTPDEVAILDNIRLSNEIVSYLDYQINRGGISAYEAAETWSEHAPEFQNIFKHTHKGE